jgi:hypothetical protein
MTRFIMVTMVFAVSMTVLLFLHAIHGTPDPRIHDEFSYLLAADTFAHGKLTNPTPGLAEHFATYHVLLEPTYQSKYPPAQGLALALGSRLFGHAIYGVFLALAAGIAATVWAACAVLPLRWAMLCGLIIILNPFLIADWGFSYWGGGVALLGGGLVLGGVLRNTEKPNLPASLLLVLGLAILSISRPFEGLILSAILIGSLLALRVYRSQQGESIRGWLPAFLVPLAAGGIVIFIANGFYNFTVTGHATLFPHDAWTQVGLAETYTGSLSLPVPEKLFRLNLLFSAPVYIEPGIWVPIIGLALIGALVRDERPTFLWISGLLAVCILTLVSVKTSKAWPHYLAPAASLFYVMIGAGFYALSRVRVEERPVGLLLVGLVLLFQLGLGARDIATSSEKGYVFYRMQFVSPGVPESGLTRGDVERYLLREFPDQRHLVLVTYGPNHSQHIEWVYNDADPNASDIIFVRSLGTESDRRLTGEFPGRLVWLAEVLNTSFRICSEHDDGSQPLCLTPEEIFPRSPVR